MINEDNIPINQIIDENYNLDNEIILQLDESDISDESEVSTDSELDEDDDLDEDDLDEDDLDNFLQNFSIIFSIFESDPEILTISYNEKILLVNLFNNMPYIYIDISNYERFKEKLLLFRVNTNVNYFLLKKITNKTSINCLDVSSTLTKYIYELDNGDNFVLSDQSIRELKQKDNTFYGELYASENKISDSMLMKFPDEILEKIILYSLPSDDLDLHRFYNIRITCKRFHRIMNSRYFIKSLIKTVNLTNQIETKFYNLEKTRLTIYKNIIYEFVFSIFKNYLLRMVGSHIINIFGGYDGYFSLPFSKDFQSECLDNLCGSECAYNYHYMHNYINAPITRGTDSKGRIFLLFIYKTYDDNIYYEFIYNNEIPHALNVTFSGVQQSTFIGNKSMNYLNTYSASYRPLLYRSYNYMKRLVNGEKTGEVRFNDSLEVAVEDFNKPVSLYYDKIKIKEYIKTNYINAYDLLSE